MKKGEKKKGERGEKGEKGVGKKPLIGFIGQGFVGKSYADDFEARGLTPVRYSLEKPYIKNKDEISACDIVFIAVPTPTTKGRFDDSIIRNAIKLVGKGKIAVIKSTVLPGTTESIQGENPDIYVLHSPEFLRERFALEDAAHPSRTIIGVPRRGGVHEKKAHEVLAVLPPASRTFITGAREAELVKYGANVFLYFKVLYANILYDVARKLGTDWTVVRDAVTADSRIGNSHMEPVHPSGHGGAAGRGAGGHCFIKDFAAFTEMYTAAVGDAAGRRVLDALRDKNVELLRESGKDIWLLAGVYGEESLRKHKKRDQ